ncbi:MAG: hypothetical protein PHR35_18360, partial [Kiritimatiellae bacterium]|nr:hypothetical protein [Kiritimatiellia bacterium]
PAARLVSRLGLQAVGYRCRDIIKPMEKFDPAQMIVAPWSLEQFPGGEGVSVFAGAERPESAINFDFYGMPERMPEYSAAAARLFLGGQSKYQVGVKVAASPKWLVALDPARELLIVRTAALSEGRYFNIADNDQPNGPYSAADLYSVFNGGSLGFFELETIGALRVLAGGTAQSALSSDTWIARGPVPALQRLTAECWGV